MYRLNKNIKYQQTNHSTMKNYNIWYVLPQNMMGRKEKLPVNVISINKKGEQRK